VVTAIAATVAIPAGPSVVKARIDDGRGRAIQIAPPLPSPLKQHAALAKQLKTG
jgi:hypothetical protein